MNAEADAEELVITPATQEEVLHPGIVLRQARESAGLSIEELALRSRIGEAKLGQLERGEFKAVGGKVYVQGYLRTLSKLLSLNGDELLAAYRDYCACSEQEEPVDASQTNVVTAYTKVERQANGSQALAMTLKVLPWVAVPAVVVLGLSMLLGGKASEEGSQSAENVVEVQSRPLQSSQSLAPTLQAAEQSDDFSAFEEGATLAASESRLQEEPQDEQLEVPSPVRNQTAINPEHSEINMQFTDECWVEVKDGTGAVIFADLQNNGDNLQLFGEAPFNIMLGNATAVTLSLDGQPVSTAVGPNRKTLRLENLGSANP